MDKGTVLNVHFKMCYTHIHTHLAYIHTLQIYIHSLHTYIREYKFPHIHTYIPTHIHTFIVVIITQSSIGRENENLQEDLRPSLWFWVQRILPGHSWSSFSQRRYYVFQSLVYCEFLVVHLELTTGSWFAIQSCHSQPSSMHGIAFWFKWIKNVNF